jgi:hypothetical protein
LLDIHRRRFRTTVEGMESKIEEKIFYHAWRLDCQRVLCTLAWRRLKVIRFESVGCCLEFLGASFRVRIASRHPPRDRNAKWFGRRPETLSMI